MASESSQHARMVIGSLGKWKDMGVSCKPCLAKWTANRLSRVMDICRPQSIKPPKQRIHSVPNMDMPELIVFGRHARLPGSILNDTSLPSHLVADSTDQSVGAQSFRKSLELRERARRCLHAADNDQSLRRALLRRSCPDRVKRYKGQWVMHHKHCVWRSAEIP